MLKRSLNRGRRTGQRVNGVGAGRVGGVGSAVVAAWWSQPWWEMETRAGGWCHSVWFSSFWEGEGLRHQKAHGGASKRWVDGGMLPASSDRRKLVTGTATGTAWKSHVFFVPQVINTSNQQPHVGLQHASTITPSHLRHCACAGSPLSLLRPVARTPVAWWLSSVPAVPHGRARAARRPPAAADAAPVAKRGPDGPVDAPRHRVEAVV